MSKKTVEELLVELHELDKKSKLKPRKLESKDGCFLLDPNNPNDREWYENDEAYDILK